VSPTDARVLLLCAELERDWQQVEHHLARAGSADPASSEHAAAFVALSLDHAYQAFESLLVRIERGLGLPARVGGGRHRELLEHSTLEIPGLRPAIVPPEALVDWATSMSFRYFLRHAYSVELDANRLEQAREALGRAVTATEPRVRALIVALKS
jgi:hypothetical protein